MFEYSPGYLEIIDRIKQLEEDIAELYRLFKELTGQLTKPKP